MLTNLRQKSSKLVLHLMTFRSSEIRKTSKSGRYEALSGRPEKNFISLLFTTFTFTMVRTLPGRKNVALLDYFSCVTANVVDIRGCFYRCTK